MKIINAITYLSIVILPNTIVIPNNQLTKKLTVKRKILDGYNNMFYEAHSIPPTYYRDRSQLVLFSV